MDAIVLGAGMVGVSTALALQMEGVDVALLDRRAPGQETSFGNMGMIQTEAAEPYAFPRSAKAILSIAFRQSNDVNWHLDALPSSLLPLISYFRNSAPARHLEVAAIYSLLTRQAAENHKPLIEASGASNLIQKDGYHTAYRTVRRFEEGSRYADRLRERYGVESEAISTATLAQAEPGLRRGLTGAIHWKQPWSCSDPGGLVTAYSDLFEVRGGKLLRGDALTLAPTRRGWKIKSDSGEIEAGNAVVALGPWSLAVMKRLGYNVPMFRKRGYHRTYRVESGPRIPFMDIENAIMCSPMQTGLRIGTGAEISRQDARATPVQLSRAEEKVGELFALGKPIEDEPWFGDRPCIVDMLPVVGRAPRHPNLWTHFGHGHQGFTLGPTTAKLLAELMVNGKTSDMVRSLALDRFQNV